jgi:hypothetical protein
MASSRNPGPICSTKYPGIDSGTSARVCTPTPGPTTWGRGALHKKSSFRRVPGLSAVAGEKAIRDGLAKAISLLEQRQKDLDTWDEDTQESFLTWFGTDDAPARDLIRRRIVKAIGKLKALTVKNFLPDRPPKKAGMTPQQYRDALDDYNSEFAYVNPDKRGGKHEMIVHLGPEFATADDTTRAGTFIHEVSHFYSVGGTDDVESSFVGMRVVKRGQRTVTMYGYSRAQRLSMKSQKGALHNADNFEFFIERQDPREHFDSEGLGDFPQSPHGV